jgi:predicted dehydrogenase
MQKRLRWGVLGTSDIARGAVVPAIQRSRLGRVEAVASRDPARAQAFARDLSIPRAAASYEALLADPEIDAVYIPLPNALHVDWTIRATSAAPIAAGAIGQVREVRAHLSVNIVRTFDPANVRYAHALGGGSLLDMGCYTVNIARMAFGAEPRSVFGRTRQDAALGIDIAASGVLEFADGFATVGCSFAADGQGSYAIVGTEGTIEVPRGIIPGLGTRNPQGLVVIVDADGNRHEESFAPADQYGLMADAFADAVLQQRPPPLLAQDALANARVLEALARSAATGRAEPI